MGPGINQKLFVTRQIPLGANSALVVCVAVLPRGSHTKVVVMEPVASPSKQVLPNYFELVANHLRIELLHLRRVRAPLQWFHYQAATAAAAPVLQEVDMACAAWHYALGVWRDASSADAFDILCAIQEGAAFYRGSANGASTEQASRQLGS